MTRMNWNNRIDHYATDETDPEEMGRRINILPGEAPGAVLYGFGVPTKVGDVNDIIAFRGPAPNCATKLFTARVFWLPSNGRLRWCEPRLPGATWR